MMARKLSLSLILATFGLSWPAIALAQQSKVIVIAPSDCKPIAADRAQSSGMLSTHVNAQNILLLIGFAS